jgi:hypothetical protein
MKMAGGGDGGRRCFGRQRRRPEEALWLAEKMARGGALAGRRRRRPEEVLRLSEKMAGGDGHRRYFVHLVPPSGEVREERRKEK